MESVAFLFYLSCPLNGALRNAFFTTSPQIKTLPDSHVAIVQEMGQQSIKMPLDNLI